MTLRIFRMLCATSADNLAIFRLQAKPRAEVFTVQFDVFALHGRTHHASVHQVAKN
jgi:hypothetical protein